MKWSECENKLRQILYEAWEDWENDIMIKEEFIEELVSLIASFIYEHFGLEPDKEE